MRGRGSPCAETKCARAETQWTEPWWHYRTFISDPKHFHSQSFHFESSQVKSSQVKAAVWLSVVYV